MRSSVALGVPFSHFNLLRSAVLRPRLSQNISSTRMSMEAEFPSLIGKLATCSFVSCSNCFGQCVLDRPLIHASHPDVDPSSISIDSRILSIAFIIEYLDHNVPGDTHSLSACSLARKSNKCLCVVDPVRFKLVRKS
jgi:hypothetical protein